MKRLIVLFVWLIFLLFPLSAWAQKPPAGTGKSLASIPFELYGDLIYIKVSVNGSKPLSFNLDSGASGCVVDLTLAKRLGLKTEGKAAGTGAGSGTYEITFAKNVNYDISGFKLAVESSYVIDLSGNISIMGRPLDGIIGYDLFARYVVIIDYDSRVLRLYEPQTYGYSGSGEIVPIVLKKKTPYFTGKLKVAGREAADREFLIDTGSGDSVDDDLVAESTAPKLEIIAGVGLGQEFKSVAGPVEWLKMGKLSVENAFGVSGRSMIGGQVLRRFRVIFDYSRGHMVLEPGRHYREAFAQDASGLNLRFEAGSKQFKIHSVHKNSPAEEAGLRVGDLITAINGRPASAFSLAQVWQMFTRDGKKYTLTVRRDKKLLKVRIPLRKFPFN